jgi:hypothetical protein
MRWSKPLHAPTFLIDENRSPPSENLAHLTDQPVQLLRSCGVAPEQDQTPRLRLTKEGALAIS